MTILDVISRSSDFLRGRGVESPRLNAELLIAHVLKLPRMRLYLEFERAIEPADLAQIRQLVRRRGNREPLQHMVGLTSFCGIDLVVDRRALVPRTETELLVELALAKMPKLRLDRPNRILDFGTGSGAIAIAIALKAPHATVHALEICENALALARENASRNGVLDRIQFHRSNGFDGLPVDLQFETVVANPPYIPRPQIETLQPEVARYDPHLALDGGRDGLDFYKLLATETAQFLRPNRYLIAEFGDDQSEEVQKIFRAQKWIVESVCDDYSGRPRFLVAIRPDERA